MYLQIKLFDKDRVPTKLIHLLEVIFSLKVKKKHYFFSFCVYYFGYY